MKRFIYLYMICLIFVTTGCLGDKPKPETKVSNHLANIVDETNNIPVFAIATEKRAKFFVNHYVKGKDVFIECVVPEVTFRNHNDVNKGSIMVYVDGRKKETISSAAFVVKGLSSGSHQIKLEIIKDKQATPIMSKKFYVTIP